MSLFLSVFLSSNNTLQVGLCIRFALQIAMVQRSAVVNDKEDETLHEELSVKDDSDFYNPQAFYANVITLFSKLRKGDCVQVKGPMTIYTRVNDGGRPLTWTSTDDDQHPTLEHVLVADVQKKYSLLKGSAKDGADLASFETMNEVFKKLHEEIFLGGI
ncbi:unnamed protein product [Rhizopus microsporus]